MSCITHSHLTTGCIPTQTRLFLNNSFTNILTYWTNFSKAEDTKQTKRKSGWVAGPRGPQAEYLQSWSAFEEGSLLCKTSGSTPGALKTRQSSSQVMETRTRRGSCRAVTICPSSLITSQNLPRDKQGHTQETHFYPLKSFPLAFYFFKTLSLPQLRKQPLFSRQ